MTPPRSTTPSSGCMSRATAAAGYAYAAVWVVGLSVWPSNLAVNASGAAVVAAYHGHMAVAAAQLVLVEGLAGLLLGTVVVAVGRGLVQAEPVRRRSRTVDAGIAAGLGAALVS